MELIVIAKPTCFKEECHLVNQLFEAGLQVFHLRKENADEAGYRKIVEGILPEYHPRIALHHFHTLANDYNIHRIHHTESFRKSITPNTLPPQKHIWSTSIHQLSDIDRIRPYHYSFYGPVFNSLSKPGYMGIIPAGFHLNKPNSNTKLIALGGIGLNQIDQVKQMNFDGIALLGCIWNDPAQALINFKKAQQHCLAYHQPF
ncbi:Thiamine-phosphate synthase [Pedobacter sp. Bi27]|uniref:thiamine phosphate synthase n=1 Tax=unclassified Pedobacter TaxID=2628915 RepID=UPI001DD6A514|nr:MULTISPECIES: thiamine phosphate synthase [unclassified Pedobacter]CAH0190957.1 Thiamine-phosphate synthase [Pedobacter sp. Bi36]CAH0214646.1 Thiamine-phosphate synthase [Pedobacter sp. Bi27]CAH0246749.1 Thiamine-phosphate synthase [Pedobacter sp. Bi126]